ncbi:DUF6522 family protein [Sneathiella sp.]|uniref:DUF6522 family protein n=1 Tax=Sneathiella sp. TaxID=1964365 RepID=UPI003FA7A24B
MREVVKMSTGAGDIEIEAAIVAKGLKRDVAHLQEDMRAGRVTCLFERGVEEDEGRLRLTFFSDTCQYRLVVDREGHIVQSSTIVGTVPVRKAPRPRPRT